MTRTTSPIDGKRRLPDAWHWVRLKDMLTGLETGSRPPGGAIGVNEGIPSLSAEHMTRFGTFDFSSLRFVPPDFYERMTRGHIHRGDILVVKDGATTGKVSFVDDDFPFAQAVVNEHVFLCRPDRSNVNPRYLFFWLWGPEGQYAIRANFQGAAIGGINQTFVDTVILPAPPLAEQNRIAALLTEQLSAAHLARTASEARLKAANNLSAACLRIFFCNALSQEWPRASLGGVSSLIIDGPHVTPSYQPSGIPFLTVRNIVQRRIDLTKVSYISEADHCEFARRGKVERGDILYTKDGTLGVPCLVETDEEFSFFVSVALIKLLRDRVDPRFMAYALESPALLQQVEKLAAGAGLKHMVLKSIRSLEVPLPTLSEQQHVATILDEQMAGVVQAHQGIEEELEAINALPSALLRRAFRGEI